MKKTLYRIKALFIRGHQQGNYPANKETDNDYISWRLCKSKGGWSLAFG
jgi:hypothetical protein